jgi:Fe-S oxidoreductase/nitrate reductase gamma subunit
MPHDTGLWMYGLTALAFAIFVYGIFQMISVWRMGKAWKPGDWKVGLKRLVVALASHKKFKQEPKPGTNHSWVFFGFVVLFIGTTLVAIDADIFELIFKAKLLEGQWYLFFELILDLFAIIFIMGVIFMMTRRYIEKPKHLPPTARPEAPWLKVGGDAYALWFLLLIGITGLVLEGIRLRHQFVVDGITYARWSFAGNALANWVFVNFEPAQLRAMYPVIWWLHFVLWTSVLAILPWTKLKHIFSSSLNIFFHDETRQARASLTTPFNLQEMMESGDMDLPDVGASTIRDFTWKDRLAFDACTNCGRCEAQCPATAAGRPLSPRKLIQDLKAQMWTDYYAEIKHVQGGGKPASAMQTEAVAATETAPAQPGVAHPEAYQPQKLTAVQEGGLATQIEEATLWSCTTCRACMTECPVDIEHVDIITEMRRAQVMESKLDEHQQKLLINLTNAGNPYGFPMADRADWANGLQDGVDVPIASELAAKGEKFEYLWWVGCSGSYDPRNQLVTQSVAKILNAAGVSFAILGVEEKCNGETARRLGEEGRFQQSVMENLMVMEQYGVTKIITQCPHCFNTLSNEYPEFGAKFEEVVHHTQLIERLIEEGRVPLKEGAEMKVAYHDSCYLGRHNDIFDAPRRVLERANGGLPVLEMADSKERGLCCGAGGANMWYEIKDETKRINVIRAKQAEETGADTVATACPFCLTMMTDGVSLNGDEEKLVVQDLAEIVVKHLDWEPAGSAPAAPDSATAAAWAEAVPGSELSATENVEAASSAIAAQDVTPATDGAASSTDGEAGQLPEPNDESGDAHGAASAAASALHGEEE